MKQLTTSETKSAIRRLGIAKSQGSAFGLFDGARNVRYAFHSHKRHQLLFPVSGMLFVETRSDLHACSPETGLWVSAGIRHATTTGACETVSAFFDPRIFDRLSESPLAIRITPLLREAAKRAAGRSAAPYAEDLFRVMHGVIEENQWKSQWATLPVGRSEMMQKTIATAIKSLGSMTIRDWAKMSGQSERTMRRRFMSELGIGPELFLQRARLIRSMQELLDESAKSITEVALEAGYGSHSAFSAAFRAFTGRTPSAFRQLQPEI